jgi:hypothetical protein
MDVLKAGVRLCAALAICHTILAQTPAVTDTKWVDAGKSKELLRKINGRWWSQDNREVYPPSKGGVFWELDSKPGVVQFFHHRPFQLDRAESLHLWMRKEEVEAALGPPNRIFGLDDHAFWYYYAANGTKVEVRFMDDGVLGEAKYTTIGEKSWSVASIEQELNGRDIYKLLQERATQRSAEWLAKKRQENGLDQAARSDALRRGVRPSSTVSAPRRPQPSAAAVDSANPPPPIPDLPAPKRTIQADALAAVSPGITREDLLSRLGEPSTRSSITSDEGVRESFTYDLDTGAKVVIRLAGGKVVQVPHP